jgi:GH15 family glucan-1,4-alpha-glucosidase
MKRTLHAMKNLLLICCCFAIVSALAQDTKQATMEKRARELHRTMGLDDKAQWKKFMKENYTKSLLERPVKSSVKTTEKETASSTSTTSTANNLEEKLKIFERLHNDFGKSKIVSLKPVNEKIEMILENASGNKGNFSIAFENSKPYLIDGIRVEIDQR